MIHKSTGLSKLEVFKFVFALIIGYVFLVGIPFYGSVEVFGKKVFLLVFFFIGLICCLVWSMHKSAIKSWLITLFIFYLIFCNYPVMEFFNFSERLVWAKALIICAIIFVFAIIVVLPKINLHFKLAFEYFSFVFLLFFFLRFFHDLKNKMMPGFSFLDTFSDIFTLLRKIFFENIEAISRFLNSFL